MHPLTLALALLAAPVPTPDAGTAPAAPSAAEVGKVMRYYYDGKASGPILVELKACLRIDGNKESPTRNECLEQVSGPVKKNTVVHAWTLWMVPDGGDYDDVAIQYLHEGQARTTVDLRLTTSLRSRTFRQAALTKSGKWEIRVLRGAQELAKIPVTVE